MFFRAKARACVLAIMISEASVVDPAHAVLRGRGPWAAARAAESATMLARRNRTTAIIEVSTGQRRDADEHQQQQAEHDGRNPWSEAAGPERQRRMEHQP